MCRFKVDLNEVQNHICKLLGREKLRLTPSDLLRTLKEQYPGMRRQLFKKVINRLVEDGRLIYSHHFVSSHLEWNHGGVIRVSKHLVLNPHSGKNFKIPECVQVSIQNGSAFGKGDHPTTLLCLKAIDLVAGRLKHKKQILDSMALDIGTGTGVLAITAVLLGASRAIGLDIDSMACHEAVANVRLNGLAQNVHIVTGGLEALKATGFNIVMANLRPPTLSRLMPEMMTRTLNGGYWILSGFRPEEMDPLKEKLSHGFQIIWTENDRNWSVFAAQRK